MTSSNADAVATAHRKISHTTEINAPIEDVWKALVDINDWGCWNKWTRLDCAGNPPSAGQKGTLRACYEGNDADWQTFPFEFAEVDDGSNSNKSSSQRVLAWTGSIRGGWFHGYHSMALTEGPVVAAMVNTPPSHSDNDNNNENRTTILVHTETFGGILPTLRLGLPYKTLYRNYRLMNESLKRFVEDDQQRKS